MLITLESGHLGLGIGSCTAIFSTDDAVLFQHLPYKNSGRLVEAFQKSHSHAIMDTMDVAPANYFDWQSDSGPFEAYAAWRPTSFNLSGGDNPERVKAAQVTADLFTVLGVEPMLGRGFRPDEDTPGKAPVVILSYGLWLRRFQGNPDVVGRTIRANDQTYAVIGIMPPDFRFPIGWVLNDMELWTPLIFTSAERFSRTEMTLSVIARLRHGATLAQGQASPNAIAQRLSREYPETNKDWGVNLIRLSDRGGSQFRQLFVYLSVAVGFVLLIACANVANLLLARGMQRQRELSVRTALGARRGRLVRQFVTEGVLLSLAGGLLGVGFGCAGIRVLSALAPAVALPELKQMTLNLQVLAIALGVSMLTGLLFSVLPALIVSGVSPQGAMQETGRSNTGTRQSNRLKAMLIVGEVALTIVLLMCAGDILNSFLVYMRIDPGFDIQNVLVMRLTLPQKRYSHPRQQSEFVARAVQEIGSLPGVSAAAAGSGAPLEEGSILWFHTADGRSSGVTKGSTNHEMVDCYRITPDYFRATGIRLLRGRGVLSSDQDSQPAVAVVNETFARKEFGDADPIGRRVFLDGDLNASATATATATAQPIETVGVVRDTKDSGLFHDTPAILFAPLAQAPEPSVSLVVKSGVAPKDIVPEIRSRIAQLDPDQAVYNIRSMDDIFREWHALFRFNTLLLTAFAAIAPILSMIGIYGVIAYTVTQRTREFGIRMALGAPRRRILMLVLKQSLWMSFAGTVLGAALAWPATRLLSRTLQQSMYMTLTRTSPLLFPVLCAGLVLIMLLMSLLPARRATQVEPMQSIACE